MKAFYRKLDQWCRRRRITDAELLVTVVTIGFFTILLAMVAKREDWFFQFDLFRLTH